MHAIRAVVLTLAVTACGGDASGLVGTGPISLAGNWTYSSPDLTGTLSAGASVTCSMFSVPVTLVQTGTTFSGSTSGGSFTCAAGGISDGGVLGTRIVVNGTVSGSDVAFDFDDSKWHHEGSLSGNSMSGSVTWTVELSTGTVVLRGNWSASR